MTKKHLRILEAPITVTAAVAMLLAMSATAAFAQQPGYPPAQDFDVVCTPQNAQPGSTVSCRVTGAGPGEELEWTATAEESGVIGEGTVTANPAGRANFRIRTTDDHAGQTVTVEVTGEESGSATTTFNVRGDDSEVLGDTLTPAPGSGSGETEQGAGEAGPQASGSESGATTRVLGVTLAQDADGQLPVTGGQVLLLSVVGLALVGGGLLALRKRGLSVS
jgi:LPXTG-motif cell wall-anchored protein